MAEEKFFKAASAQEVCDLLAQYGGSACLLAGGTDVMVSINERAFSPEVLIYIGECGLSGIREEGGGLCLGAATPYADIINSPLVAARAPLLQAAVSQIGSPAIRNAGTIGGNLGTASPAADSATALLALGASLKIVSKEGERSVAVADFFTGPRQNDLRENELIQEVVIPAPPAGTRWAYRKLGKRRAQSLSVVSVAVYCVFKGSVCTLARIALGAVAPTPMLALEAAEKLQAKTLNAELIEQAARAAAAATDPIDDVRSSAWYRRRASEVLVKRLLTEISA